MDFRQLLCETFRIVSQVAPRKNKLDLVGYPWFGGEICHDLHVLCQNERPENNSPYYEVSAGPWLFTALTQ